MTALAKTAAIAVIGDSYTFNTTLGMTQDEFLPAQLQALLRAQNKPVRCRNFAISGNTSSQMLARIACMTQYDVPVIAAIYAGVNDAQYNTTVASASSSTVFNVQAGFGQRFLAGTWITVNGVSRQVLSVATDTITLATALGGTPTVGHVVAMDTRKNIERMAAAMFALGCLRFAILGVHYYNGAGYDTVATPYAGSTALRAIQAAVVADIVTLGADAVYVDNYTYMAGLISNATPVIYTPPQPGSAAVTYTFTQSDGLWQILSGNNHPTAVCSYVIAKAVLAAITAKTGWLAALG